MWKRKEIVTESRTASGMMADLAQIRYFLGVDIDPNRLVSLTPEESGLVASFSRRMTGGDLGGMVEAWRQSRSTIIA